MLVELYDGRTGTTRWRDVPFPLQAELTLTVWVPHATRQKTKRAYSTLGEWAHTVWSRCAAGTSIWYEFRGTAPTAGNRSHTHEPGLPDVRTTPWPRPLHVKGLSRSWP